MNKINRVNTKKLTWVDINHPSRSDLGFMKTKHKFSEEDIQNALPSRHAQRPRVLVRNNYLFIVVLFPVYNYQTRSINAAEVDVFITNDHLFTIHDSKIKIIHSFFESISTDKTVRNSHQDDKPSFLFYEILDKLYENVFPMLDNVNKDIKNIEENVFAQTNRDLIRDILIVKSNLLNFKRIMHAHRSMIKKLLKTEASYFGSSSFVQMYYSELFDHVKDIWGVLETYGESIESLENTSNAIIDQGVNRIVKTLTIVTVLLYPLSMLGGIFGMNARNMPIIGNPLDFWILIGIMLTLSTTIYFVFKKKGWM